jgi:hypothetical protein
LGGVRGEALVKELLDDFGEALFVLHAVADESADFVVGEDFPDSVAAHEDEGLGAVEGDGLDVGVGGDELLLGLELGVLLVLEVSDGSGEVQVAVDSAVDDEASSVGDSGALDLVVGLVVLRESGDLAVLVQQRPRVSSVGDVHGVVLDEHDVGGASGAVLRLLLVLEGSELVLALWGDQHLVHFQEGLLEGLFEVAVL